MINYSLSARPVNPGNAESEKKIYANAQVRKTTDLQQLARHIQQHGSPYTRDVIAGVLTAAVDCLREMLLDGQKVSLGELGSFSVSLTSTGVEDATKFNPAQHITKVNVVWDKGQDFRDLRADAEFQYVTTRKEQAEAKRLEKEALNASLSGQTTDSGSDNGGGDVTE